MPKCRSRSCEMGHILLGSAEDGEESCRVRAREPAVIYRLRHGSDPAKLGDQAAEGRKVTRRRLTFRGAL